METEQKEKNENEKNPSYLKPSRILSHQEYSKYKQYKKEIKKEKLQEQLRNYKRQATNIKINKGRFQRGFKKSYSFIRQPARTLYNLPLKKTQRQKLTPQQIVMIKQRIQKLKQVRQMQTQQQEKNYYDWVFSNFASPQFNQAGIVEKEISNFNGGYGNDGNNVAVGMEREINFHSNAGHPRLNIMQQLNKEVLFHSIIPSIKNSFDVEREAFRFASLLP